MLPIGSCGSAPPTSASAGAFELTRGPLCGRLGPLREAGTDELVVGNRSCDGAIEVRARWHDGIKAEPRLVAQDRPRHDAEVGRRRRGEVCRQHGVVARCCKRDEQRYDRCGVVRLRHELDLAREREVVHDDRRAGDLDRHRRRLEPREQRQEIGPPGGEGAGARALRGASGGDQVERPLPVRGEAAHERNVEERRAVEHDGAHRARVAPEEDLRRGGAVADPVEVELHVAERLADRLEVVHRGRGPVLGGIAGERRRAALDVCGELRRSRDLPGRRCAGERIRAACTTLVDEEDVAVRPQLEPDARHGCGRLGRRSAGPACEVDERVVVCSPQGGGEHRDSQRDRAPGRDRAVLRHGERPAAGGDALHGALVERHRRMSGRRGADRRRAGDRDESTDVHVTDDRGGPRGAHRDFPGPG